MESTRPGAFPQQPSATVPRTRIRTRRRCPCERSLPVGTFVTTQDARLDGPYVPEWLGRSEGGECSPSPPVRPQCPVELCDQEIRGFTHRQPPNVCMPHFDRPLQQKNVACDHFFSPHHAHQLSTICPQQLLMVSNACRGQKHARHARLLHLN